MLLLDRAARAANNTADTIAISIFMLTYPTVF
jgi:hypothetical protein